MAVGPSNVGAEGNGLKFGDARLHPFLDVVTAFDSAAALVSSSTSGKYETAGDLLLHFRPGFKLELPGSGVGSETTPMFVLGLNANAEYVLYTGAINAGTRNTSHFGLDGDLDVGINRFGQFGVDLGDHVTRSDRNTSTPALAIGTLSLYNDARLKLNIRPYNGAITIEPGYHFTLESFSPLSAISVCTGTGDPSCDPGKVSQYDYLNHTVNLNGRWKFLPKTAITLDSALGIRQYPNAPSSNMTSLKAALGLAGLLTTHFEVMLRVGWGQDFSLSSYSSVIGQAEVGYLFSQTGAVRLGYVRTFEPTGGGATIVSYGDDRGYLDGRILLGGKLTLRGTVNFDYLSFRGTDGYGQLNTSVDLGVDYEVTSWFNIGVDYRLSYLYAASHPVQVGLNSFIRNEGILKLEVIY